MKNIGIKRLYNEWKREKDFCQSLNKENPAIEGLDNVKLWMDLGESMEINFFD